MASSRSDATPLSPGLTRVSFAKIREPLAVPDLLALQTASFDWLLGGEDWRARVAAEIASGNSEIPQASGLTEIFEEISPIEDFAGSMSLSFRDHRFEPPKYTVDQCREKDFTYSAPLFVTAEFMNNETGEIKSQTVFMGDFPLMTDKGTFIINGTERVVVSQLVRSPGVYFERSVDKTTDKDVFVAKIIPSRGAWLEFEIDKKDLVARPRRPQAQAARHRAAEGPRHDARGDPRARSATTRPSWPRSRRTTSAARRTRSSTSTASCVRASRRPSRHARNLLDNFYFNSKRYDLAKVGRYKVNKKLGLDLPLRAERADPRGHRRDHRVPGAPARRPHHDGRPARRGRRARPTTSTTSATVASAPSAS